MIGRVDYPRFQNGVELLENWILHVQGGVTRRWGMKYIGEVKDSSKATRIIPLEFGGEEYVLLELGNLYARFWKNDSPIGGPLEVTTVYTASELFEIQIAQSNDVIYMAHPNHPVKKLVRLASDSSSWEFKTVSFLPPPSFEKEVNPSITLTPVQAVSGAGINFYGSDDFFLAADKDKMIQIGDSRAIITAVDAAKYIVTADIIDAWAASYHVAGGTGNLSSSGTTVTVTGHGLTSANIGDVILLTSGAQADEFRRIDAVPTADTITIDSAFTVDQSSVDWERGVHMDSGAWKFIGSPAAKLTADKVGPIRGIITMTLDTAGWRDTDATKSWDFTDIGKYVKAMGGLIKVTEITSETVAKGQILSALTNAPSSAPFETLSGTWTLEEESWTASNGYPGAVCFYEQRLFFGGTTIHPQTIWGSVTDDYENFAAGALATASVEYTIATNDFNPIRWFASARVLLIGTSAREFRASGGNDPISPTNIDIRAETSYGSPKRRPVSIGHTTIFVQRAKRRLREMAYSFESDAYEAGDLTVISPHISEGGIEEVAYYPEPYAILYAIRGDGQLLSLTYEKEQEVFGWGRVVTDGSFESVAILPPVAGSDKYQAYFIVNRTINGATKRYIEKFDETLHTDCAKTGTGPITTITGLTYLEGETVKMKGDDALYPDGVVSGGQVSFPESVDAYEVGLPYISTLVTHRPELETKKGSVQGKPKRWNSLYVRCVDTIGLKINGDQIGTRDPSDLLGEAVDPEDGDFRADTLGIDGDAKITIMQDLPFPATVVLIVGELVVGD
jgi:hypothetical protein